MYVAKKDKGEKAPKAAKQLGIATVVKPCLMGIVLLTIVQAALTAVSP